MKNTLTAAIAALAFSLPLATTALANTNVNAGTYYAAPVVAIPQAYTLKVIGGGCAAGSLDQMSGSAYGLFDQLKACSIVVYGAVAPKGGYGPYTFEYATNDFGAAQG